MADAPKYLSDEERARRRYAKNVKSGPSPAELENQRQADVVSAQQTQDETEAKRKAYGRLLPDHDIDTVLPGKPEGK